MRRGVGLHPSPRSGCGMEFVGGERRGESDLSRVMLKVMRAFIHSTLIANAGWDGDDSEGIEKEGRK